MDITALNADSFRSKLIREGNLLDWRRSYTEFPSLEEAGDARKWDHHASNNTTSEHPVTKQRIKQTVEMVRKICAPGVSVLDFGVGYGDVAKALSTTNLKFEYLGIDISEQFVANLVSCLRHDDRFKFKQESLFDLQDETFDIVLALEVLEHVAPPNTFKVLEKLRALLKPGGVFVASVPLGDDLALSTTYCSGCGRMENPNGHVRSYTEEILCCELQHVGLKPFATQFVKSGASLKSRLYHAFRKTNPFNVLIAATKE